MKKLTATSSLADIARVHAGGPGSGRRPGGGGLSTTHYAWKNAAKDRGLTVYRDSPTSHVAEDKAGAVRGRYDHMSDVGHVDNASGPSSWFRGQ